MEKKTMVVVGAGKGMGNYVAREFARNGYRAVLMARDGERLAGYRAEFERDGLECFTVAADASDPESLTRAFHDVEQRFGAVDTLVYNAAILTAGMPSDLTSADLMEHYQVDVASALHCANLVAPGQEASGAGTILFTGGGLGSNPMAEYACISVDKAALRALAIALNQELAPKGIFVGVVTITGNVAPGTRFDPADIAKVYWAMHEDRSDVETVY